MVSILIPCHNAARWLGATLDSALAQTWPRCEIIVIDDGSTDDSPRLAASYANRGVQLLRQPQRGAAAARNATLNRARGDYLQFLDADDLLAPEKIASQITRLAAAPAGSVASAAWTRFRDDPSISQFIPEPVWCDALPLDWLVLSWSGGGMMHPAAWLVPRRGRTCRRPLERNPLPRRRRRIFHPRAARLLRRRPLPRGARLLPDPCHRQSQPSQKPGGVALFTRRLPPGAASGARARKLATRAPRVRAQPPALRLPRLAAFLRPRPCPRQPARSPTP
ncbi:glycosyltransferase family 2 protein [Opitutaceae bacterium TAV4]|nr:glycosyltransferase family 2 protein [Opitutaceae bacterium TAV4]